MRKLAVIRDVCPFGLEVNSACKSAGNSVDKMCALPTMDPNTDNSEIEIAISNNRKIFDQISEKKPCKYAAHIFPGKDNTVDCDWGDTAAGQEGPTFTGSNYYEQLFNGVGFSGLYAVPPMSGANDPYAEVRNVYYGLSEFARSSRENNMIKRSFIWYSIGLTVMASRKEDAIKKYPEFEKDINYFIDNDPSGNLKYLDWELKILKSRQALLPEISDVVQLFHKFVANLSKKDINQYKPEEFSNLRNNLLNIKEEKNKKEEKVEERYRIDDQCEGPTVYEDDHFVVKHIKNKAASVHYGIGTEWCIAMKSHGYFEDYTMNNVVFFFIFSKDADKSDSMYKIAAAIARDIQNNVINKDYFNSQDLRINEKNVIEFLGDSADGILSVISNISKTEPKSAIARLFYEGASAEESEKIFNLYNKENYLIKEKIFNLLIYNENTAPDVLKEIIEFYGVDSSKPADIMFFGKPSSNFIKAYYEFLNSNRKAMLEDDYYHLIAMCAGHENVSLDVLEDIYNKMKSDSIPAHVTNKIAPKLLLDDYLPLNLIDKLIDLIKIDSTNSHYFEALIERRKDLHSSTFRKIYKKMKLTPDKFDALYAEMARNPRTPIDILNIIYKRFDNIKDLLENKNLPQEIVKKIFNHLFEKNWPDEVISHGKDIDSWKRVLEDKYSSPTDTMLGLLNHPNSTPEIRDYIKSIFSKFGVNYN